MKVLFVIPARGGSKGIPRKNLRSLAGQPLIGYTIQNALASTYDADVYVSTEDEEIKITAEKFGAKTHDRSNALAEDHITLDSVIFDAYQAATKAENTGYDLIVTLQPTSPLLKTTSIDQALKLMEENVAIDTTLSVVNDTHLTWGQDDSGYFPNYEARVNRQYLPPAYKETGGFLITRPRTISAENRIGKKVELFELPKHEAIDIDGFEDWNLCEYYLKRKTIVFCIAGYSEIGLGHVYNTLILANEILNHRLVFVVTNPSDLAYAKIAENNYEVYRQGGETLAEAVLKHHPDVVINDVLDTTPDYIEALKAQVSKVINFEDLGEGAKAADLVFNAIYPEKEKYPNHHYGPDFFCAREEFMLTPGKPFATEVKEVLITFGGVDPNNLTHKVLQAILPYCQEQDVKVNVIAGLGYDKYETIAGLDGATIHRDVKNISGFMAQADLAFTSAGRTTYELALMGVPSIVLAQNERELSHFFAYEAYGFKNLGLGSSTDQDTVLRTLQSVLTTPEVREEMRAKMLACDLRQGKKRVINMIQNLVAEL